MKRRKGEIIPVGVLAVVAGAATTIMAWRFPDLITALSIGWLVSTGVVSRFPRFGPRETPGKVSEFRRSSIDECACGQDAERVISHVCSRSVLTVDLSINHVGEK
ncbi:hypothetical protein [Actinoplanes subglobosus]|uniref:Uncharacterized protein n=1 Tax=Actinoplanes subglobosus TaxID=1547892 RepID=A0ABV8IHJ9_9ACTN